MHPNLETLTFGDRYHIAHQRGWDRRLFICLSGVGTKRGQVPDFEFPGSASDRGRNHVLQVADKGRSWMNDPELVRDIVRHTEAITAKHGITEVIALGNSMGGFMALVLPGLTRIDRVIAFAPQFSMHPDHVPEETRWQFWRRRIASYRFETIGGLDPKKCGYFILHGDDPKEAIHWRRFPEHRRLNHYVLRNKGHNLTADLKQDGLLPRAIRLAAAGRPRALRLMLEAHYGPCRRQDHRPAPGLARAA